MGVAKRLAAQARCNKYAIYVLFLCTLSYMVNQLDVFSLIATNISMANELKYGERVCSVGNVTALDILLSMNGSNGTSDSERAEFCISYSHLCAVSSAGGACAWYYTGLGWEYQLLAGPAYIVLFSISGIPLGLISELNSVSRQKMLGVCCLLWGAMTVLGGFAQRYWHIAITRLLLGIFSAGCVPFCASIISDYFPKGRGGSLGFFNWGVYVGYSFTFLLLIAEKQLGWRVVYFIAGSPALALALLIWSTIREPHRLTLHVDETQQESITHTMGTCKALGYACHQFVAPVLLLLCLGGAIRNGAGFVWAYNIVQFFSEYHPGTNVEDWMTWIPLVFGSMGAFGGGYLSDRLSRHLGVTGRLVVLIACCVVSAPFQVGTLYLPMPWAFIVHIPAYLIGEMWIGVCVAIVIDLVPGHLTTSAVAIYFFIIQIIGGNMNIIVTPLAEALNFRLALVITFPGFYLIGALLFAISLTVHLCYSKQSENLPVAVPSHDSPISVTDNKPDTPTDIIEKQDSYNCNNSVSSVPFTDDISVGKKCKNCDFPVHKSDCQPQVLTKF